MSIEIGLLIALVSGLIGYLSYNLNRNKQLKQDGRQDAETNAKLEYISKGVDDIRIDLKATDKQTVLLGERITRAEESAKSAHRRLDVLEKDSNK